MPGVMPKVTRSPQASESFGSKRFEQNKKTLDPGVSRDDEKNNRAKVSRAPVLSASAPRSIFHKYTFDLGCDSLHGFLGLVLRRQRGEIHVFAPAGAEFVFALYGIDADIELR